MARDAQDVVMGTIWRRYTGARADRHPEMIKAEEPFMTSAKTMKMHRWQHRNLRWLDQKFSYFTASDQY